MSAKQCLQKNDALPFHDLNISQEDNIGDILQGVQFQNKSVSVVDIGGFFSPLLVAAGLENVLVVSEDKFTLEQYKIVLQEKVELIGQQGVRGWCGKASDIPPEVCPFDIIICSGESVTQSDVIQAVLLAQQQSQIVLVQGQSGDYKSSEENSGADQPSDKLGQLSYETWAEELPLDEIKFFDNNKIQAASYKIREFYQLRSGVVQMEANIVTGFGRGSRELLVPTANLNPEQVVDQTDEMNKGVYFGYAQLQTSAVANRPAGDFHVLPMVLNYGNRPTADGGEPTIEAHIMHNFNDDFYGDKVRVEIVGFIRPEVKFSNFMALKARIGTDINIATSALQNYTPSLTFFKQ